MSPGLVLKTSHVILSYLQLAAEGPANDFQGPVMEGLAPSRHETGFCQTFTLNHSLHEQ